LIVSGFLTSPYDQDRIFSGEAMRIRIESNDTESRGFSNNVYTPSKVVTSSDTGRSRLKWLVLRFDQLDVQSQTLKFLHQHVERLGQSRLQERFAFHNRFIHP